MIKDYDIEIMYHLGKANVVVDALSRKSRQEKMMACLTVQPELEKELMRYEIGIRFQRSQGELCFLDIESSLLEMIRQRQQDDPRLSKIIKDTHLEKVSGLVVHDDGILRFHNRICVPVDMEIKTLILKEAHASPYSIHLGANKMYKDLRKNFWWSNMKQEVADFVTRCLTCQQVKLNIEDPLDSCNHFPSRNGSGRISL